MRSFHHETFTNHIVYAHLNFDLPDFALDELSDLSLLISFIPELGVGERSYVDNLSYIPLLYRCSFSKPKLKYAVRKSRKGAPRLRSQR